MLRWCGNWGQSYQFEEEGCLVCLQGYLRVKDFWARDGSILRKKGWCGAQLLDELHPSQWCTSGFQADMRTFLRAL